MESFYSNGKLLITGEYVVLDGAKALAVPTKKGQLLAVQPINRPQLIWESFDENDKQWLKVEFDIPRLRILSETFDPTIEDGSDSLALKLKEVLLEAKKLNPQFLAGTNGLYAKSKLDFSRNWGLGSSSTLVNNIAQWANVDAFELQLRTFGGSAYDIACAQHNRPLMYQLINRTPNVKQIEFNPSFNDQLYFVHLNKKQDSREGIAMYRKFKGNKHAFAEEISSLSNEVLKTNSLDDFERILVQHEQIISSIIQQKPIQEVLFSDYFGQTKSLGAWGGDFILATGTIDTPYYFKNKGFQTVIPYQEMVL